MKFVILRVIPVILNSFGDYGVFLQKMAVIPVVMLVILAKMGQK